MKLVNLQILLLLFTITAVCDGLWIVNEVNSLKTKFKDWLSRFHYIGENVNVLFSPNVFELYNYRLDNMSDIIDNELFDKSKPTVIYIHGWLSNGELEQSVMAIRSAYRYRDDTNFIAIDWSTYSHWNLPIPYYSSMTKLKEICLEIAQQLEKIRQKDSSTYTKFYLAGHSLGGECAGLVGREVKRISNGKFVIPRIYALDPAGPGYEFQMEVHVTGFDRISKTDAKYVQIIHTNAGKLGIVDSVGHADFYPNGGKHQPGCGNRICDHSFGWMFFQQTVRDDGSFIGIECDSFSNFKNGKCEHNKTAIMGLTKDLPYGVYYLRTHPSVYNSALGFDGIKTEHLKIFKDTGVVEDVADDSYMRSLPYEPNMWNSTDDKINYLDARKNNTYLEVENDHVFTFEDDDNFV